LKALAKDAPIPPQPPNTNTAYFNPIHGWGGRSGVGDGCCLGWCVWSGGPAPSSPQHPVYPTRWLLVLLGVLVVRAARTIDADHTFSPINTNTVILRDARCWGEFGASPPRPKPLVRRSAALTRLRRQSGVRLWLVESLRLAGGEG
jgi:hypothetical protein